MGLRIRFTAADLARVRFATEPDPFWETLLSVHALQHRRPASRAIGAWRRHVGLDDELRRLCALAPARGYSPDFLTPAESAAGFNPGLAALIHTPAQRVGAELDLLRADGGTDTPWLRELQGGGDALSRFAGTLAGYFHEHLSPMWTDVTAAVHRDLGERAPVLLHEGVAAALDTLSPWGKWRDPYLELDVDHLLGEELDLAGRGLRLIPAYFCHETPTLLADPGLPPVLVYPLSPSAVADRGKPATPRALNSLLGASRATVLRAIATGKTTTELSTAAEISVPAASYHASVLRAAGLIETRRAGRAVQHALTPLGADLLGHRSTTEIPQEPALGALPETMTAAP